MSFVDTITGLFGISQAAAATPVAAAPVIPAAVPLPRVQDVPSLAPIPGLDAALRAVIAHGVDANVWLAALTPPMRSSGVVTPRRIAALLGQCAEETGGFTVLSENMNYSADALVRVWPTHFTPALAAEVAHNPERIANIAYADRMGNADVQSGDGWRYRGGGALQNTGKNAFMAISKATGKPLDECANWVRSPVGAASAACLFWSQNRLNAIADAWDLTTLTRRVNGGLINLDRRVALCNAALKAMGG